MAKSRINWILAQHDYLISCDTSLTDIAKKYDISLSRVKKVSMKQRWSETKEKVWEKARENALVETGQSAKDLLIRHSRIARYFQETGVKFLKTCISCTFDKDFNKDINNIHLMLRMLTLGLKIERDLYSEALKRYYTNPKAQPLNEGRSQKLTDAIKYVYKHYPNLWNKNEVKYN